MASSFSTEAITALSLNLCLSEMRGWHQWLLSLEKYQELSHLEPAKIHRLPIPKLPDNIS